MKKLSTKDEKTRRMMSGLKVGDFVANTFSGEYGFIKGFKTPWIWIVRELDDPIESYETHFTDLQKPNKRDILFALKSAHAEVKEIEKIAKLAGIKL